MENCFRFLINVDQCLNMSHFDIFFYKLQSRHKFHLNQVQMFGDSNTVSLRSAITDIRMYLDKYPYHIGDCQIIVAMRGKYQNRDGRWEDSLLYRLLQLNYELKKARIYINSRERVERALNLIMLYDADFTTDFSELGHYFSSQRFKNDCEKLLGLIGGSEATQTQLPQLLQAYQSKADADPVLAELLERCCCLRQESLPVILEGSDPAVAGELSMRMVLPPFLKENLVNFQVFEAAIDRNNRRDNILGLLRIVEFINMSVERLPSLDGSETTISLSQQCIHNWNQVWSDVGLEQRYATMLHRYQQRLHNAAMELERPMGDSPNATDLPDREIPADDAIKSEDAVLEKDGRKEDKSGKLTTILENFRKNSTSAKNAAEQWRQTHKELKTALDDMEHKLKLYAGELSRKYAAIQDERKREGIAWRNNHYTAKKDTEVRISQMEYARDECLRQLKSPQMTPSLKFQDQLNMENVLQQSNLKILHLTRCLSAVTIGNFAVLIGICMLLFVLHYTLLQPYALQGINTLAYYLIYIGVAFVLMTLSWNLPYQFFRKKIHLEIDNLKNAMKIYIQGYFEKANQFEKYINLLNQLDFINRYLRLLKRAHSTSHKLSQGYLWHKVQVRNHIDKLKFFQGLIELDSDPNEENTSVENTLPGIAGDRVSDVIDSPLYWPQS